MTACGSSQGIHAALNVPALAQHVTAAKESHAPRHAAADLPCRLRAFCILADMAVGEDRWDPIVG